MKFSAMKCSALRAIATAVGPVMIASCSAHLKTADVTGFPAAGRFPPKTAVATSPPESRFTPPFLPPSSPIAARLKIA